mmetsp:Transcript_11824/g.10054  ORF Transcript_11824/g.10054 Transcript_11824/m.10054 type:complete len:812 (+) Transcript_11824:36-2471(+)|eukprot:CAMPEP_0179444074 /NCGR_PEP_ID=MMETSP0799-20121207/27558_1 /TAXON_ID=46947 /ORGANISM="Geminigera cryophila, Strain CCMP2564" /LENGTH=811 /DNA_ID=CAMNT_0021230829 /DNA_START=34 /DNA_END=2469 /DNA_ORIENTATION=-
MRTAVYALAALAAASGVTAFMPQTNFAGRAPSLRARASTRSAVSVGPRMVGTVKPDVMPYKTANPASWAAGDVMRPRWLTSWDDSKSALKERFGYSDGDLAKYDNLSKEDQMEALYMMHLSRQFETACNQAYMQGNIRGFMHLDNGQESIPALVYDSIKKGDKKYSYYREHTHALASGVQPGPIMAELFGKIDGTCKGAGGSMHIFDKETNFQGGWALVAEQLPYAAGAARSILLDRLRDAEAFKDDDRLSVVFIGEGGSQNGRMAEVLNAAAKENLPLLIIVIDNGRAINTFTGDVAANQDVYLQGQHYGVPGIKVDGCDLDGVLKAGRAVTDYVRTKGPAILQVHTFRFNGHSPADPEHERGRKQEKKWAREAADPIAIYEAELLERGTVTQAELDEVKARANKECKDAVKFASDSSPPPANLAKELEFPDKPNTDYNLKTAPQDADAINARTLEPEALATCNAHMETLRDKARAGQLTIGDAINLAVLEEMIRDPTTTIHAEDLQAGSSYDIPKLTQQTFGKLRAADEIIDEGHFLGKALGEGMNGYRPIVEMMNTNFAIYGMAEISSLGNTYATTGGKFDMPVTIVGAGGTAPAQSLGAEHSQPFHAYIMGIPGLKICSAASPEAAYGLTKSMIRDNGPGMLFCPVKMMKDVKGSPELGKCMPLNKAALLNKASDASVKSGKAVTVLTYLHGVREAQTAMLELQAEGMDIDLIELRSLKPLDKDTIRESLTRTNKLAILDESTYSGGIGATISAMVSEEMFDLLDAPVKRLCMDDAPVPYSLAMEAAVVKRASDLVTGVADLVFRRF